MLRPLLGGLAVVAVTSLVLPPSPAAAVTSVATCRPLDKAGETYVVTADITASGDCFPIRADRITLDLGGHTVTGPGDAAGVWDGAVARTLTLVKNGSITGFGVGIGLGASPRTTVRAVEVSGNAGGIFVGPNSLVKDCVAKRNTGDAITAGDGTQVEGCVLGGPDPDRNGRDGINGGHRMLVTRNTITNNRIGILIGDNSTVTRNTVNDNGRGGIGVGLRSLVTYNTVNGNDGDGISAFAGSQISYNTVNDNHDDGIVGFCPMTITYNEIANNFGQPIETIGEGCVLKGNVIVDAPK